MIYSNHPITYFYLCVLPHSVYQRCCSSVSHLRIPIKYLLFREVITTISPATSPLTPLHAVLKNVLQLIVLLQIYNGLCGALANR